MSDLQMLVTGLQIAILVIQLAAIGFLHCQSQELKKMAKSLLQQMTEAGK